MVPAPIAVDVRRGAIADLANLLADQRISSTGRVAIVVGPSTGPTLAGRLHGQLDDADQFTVRGGTVDAAIALVDEVRRGSYDAIVGIGGGRVIDATKFAAARVGLPMVAAATNLAHDGIASPVSILDNDAGRGSYGVPAPIAVVIDLDLVAQAPRRSVAAGIGEALSNISAVADWLLAREQRGDVVDGLAVTLSRAAAEGVVNHPGGLTDDAFLETLAEALVLSGLAMVVAGTSHPCSGGCHEISHAIDLLFPARAGYHGEQVGMGAAFASYLRESPDFARIATVLRRHGLPVLPQDLGFDDEEFLRVVAYAPQTRPGRHTILEQLNLDESALRSAIAGYHAAVASVVAEAPEAREVADASAQRG